MIVKKASKGVKIYSQYLIEGGLDPTRAGKFRNGWMKGMGWYGMENKNILGGKSPEKRLI